MENIFSDFLFCKKKFRLLNKLLYRILSHTQKRRWTLFQNRLTSLRRILFNLRPDLWNIDSGQRKNLDLHYSLYYILTSKTRRYRKIRNFVCCGLWFTTYKQYLWGLLRNFKNIVTLHNKLLAHLKEKSITKWDWLIKSYSSDQTDAIQLSYIMI